MLTKRPNNPYRGEGFSLRKQTYVRRGKRYQSRRWNIRFQDHRGTWQEFTAATDKTVSAQFGRRLVKLVHYKLTGEPLPVELSKWIDGLPVDMLKKLTALQLVNPNMADRAKSLREHVEDWEKSLIAGRRTRKMAADKRRMVLAIIGECGRLTDLDAERVKGWLAEKQAEGLSDQRRNHYRGAVRQFSSWMVKTARATSNPMKHLEAVTVHRKYERRALSTTELRRLVKVAKTGGDYLRTTGPERAVVYALAASTGLRANEVRSLTAGSFELDGSCPTVRVESMTAKNRQECSLPLTPELVVMLRGHLGKKLPTARAFSMPEKAAKMLRVDLTAAKISEHDERGRVVDFHSLRTTFITSLARAGVHPRKAQLLARHCDINLTMGFYSKLDDSELREATQALPKLA